MNTDDTSVAPTPTEESLRATICPVIRVHRWFILFGSCPLCFRGSISILDERSQKAECRSADAEGRTADCADDADGSDSGRGLRLGLCCSALQHNASRRQTEEVIKEGLAAALLASEAGPVVDVYLHFGSGVRLDGRRHYVLTVAPVRVELRALPDEEAVPTGRQLHLKEAG